MAKGKNILTTGDVAKICNVAPRTVSKWFDNGQLRGYRIPGSKDRRIPMSELIRFMKEHNMPLSALPVGKLRILIIDSNDSRASVLSDKLKAKVDYEIQIVNNNFETGVVAQKFAPHVLLIRVSAEGIDADEICEYLRSDEELQTIKIIAIAEILNENETKALLQKGFDACVSDSDNVAEIIKKIEETTAIIY